MQGLQSQALSEPGSRCQQLPEGGNQNDLLAVRKGNHGSFPPDAGTARVLPRMFPTAAVHEFTGLARGRESRLPQAAGCGSTANFSLVSLPDCLGPPQAHASDCVPSFFLLISRFLSSSFVCMKVSIVASKLNLAQRAFKMGGVCAGGFCHSESSLRQTSERSGK
jgi:hypothetical protein